MNSDEAKHKNIIDMAFGFSAMTRVFEKRSTAKIVNRLDETLSQIASLKNGKEFQNLHDDFCRWFAQNVKTAERKNKNGTIKPSMPASYGQGAKVLDVALKVFVHYCNLPSPVAAEKIKKWLNAAVDTKMMKHLKEMPNAEASSIAATSIEDVDEKTYATLQSLVRKDIIENKVEFPNTNYPVEWDDIMWRRLNSKDKKNKEAEILGINYQEHHQVHNVQASITGQTNTYKTGVERGQEILEITLSKPGYAKHNIPWTGLVDIKLIIGQSIYNGKLNLKRKDGVPWISSVIYDSRGKKLALRTPLIASGYNKGPVSLQVDIVKKEIIICP